MIRPGFQPGRPRAYLAFFQRSLSAHLAYAGSFWLNLAALSVGFGFTVLVWAYARPAGQERGAFFAYLALAFCLNFTSAISLERIVGERIREGLIATDMLKPVDMTAFYLVQGVSDVTFQALFALPALALAWAFLGPALLPASGTAAWLALAGVALGVLVNFFACFLFVQMIFLTNSNYGPFATRVVLHNAFSGIFAPLAVYPASLKAAASWLPFQHVIHTPVALWQGRLAGPEALRALAGSAVWLLALALVSRLSFDRIRRSLSIQGG